MLKTCRYVVLVLYALVLSTTGPYSQVASFTGSNAGAESVIYEIPMCWCPAGQFTMGSPPGEPERRPDEAQVEVILTKGFWMSKYEVTQ